MGWIAMPFGDGGVWQANVVDALGRNSLLPLGKAATQMQKLGTPNRRRLIVDLAKGQVGDAAEYLAHFGIAANPAHDTITFTEGDMRIVIPSFLLADALFTPLPALLPHLLHPTGLDNLVLPTADDSGAEHIAIQAGRLNTLLRQRGIHQVLAWFYHFPTARQCWSSFRHALHRGKFSLLPPKAHARLKLAGHVAGDTFYVTRSTVIHVDIDEDPVTALNRFPRTISYRKCSQPRHGRTAPPLANLSLAATRGTKGLSDQEWLAIKPILAGKLRPTKHPLRLILDGIVRKLTTGDSWAKTVYETGDSANASVLYSKLVRSGVWRQIVAALEQVADRNSNSGVSEFGNPIGTNQG